MNATALQQDFATALLDPARDAPAALRTPSGIDVQRRFGIHRNNVIGALVDALGCAFPVTQALVGADFFRAMACERVRTDPPRSPVIDDYGDGFAEFIDGFAPAAGVPYLADIARLERLRARAFHAADATPVALAQYRALTTDPERLAATRVTLHPGCGWLRSGFAAWSLWNAHQRLDSERDADLATIAIDRPQTVLVMRQQWTVQIVVITDALAAALDALRDGCTLGASIVAVDNLDQAQLVSRFESLLLLIVRHGLAVALDSLPESSHASCH